MLARMKTFKQIFNRRSIEEKQETLVLPEDTPPREVDPGFDIAPNDPIIAYFQSTPGVMEIDKLNLDSPALQSMKRAGVMLAVPLVSQGELIGLLNLGPRLSEQEYSSDDRGLLNNLATQAAPALRVAHLVRQQQLEVQARERIEHELRVARLIQQTLLPKELPQLQGWQIAAYYQPARAVGGDFYDFINLPGGRLGLVVGDVTDKGVPAALVMATTRSILRGAAEQFNSPGEILERANELLSPDIPPNMFVTCLYGILDPLQRRLIFANAGHDLPFRRSSAGVDELRATGMPLGLMPGMHYEEREVELCPGESIVLYSDGIIEAHNPLREMFGFPRMRELLGNHPGGAELIDYLLDQLRQFTGDDWEQEDDVTILTLECLENGMRESSPEGASKPGNVASHAGTRKSSQPLADFTLASQPGNERQAVEKVTAAIEGIRLQQNRLERLKTAVAEATMNAMEHGNKYRADLPVSIYVYTIHDDLIVRITDYGGGTIIPEPETPDLEAKLAGLQTPRGWGLFLIKNMVDDVHVTSDESHHTVELILHLKGEEHDSQGS